MALPRQSLGTSERLNDGGIVKATKQTRLRRLMAKYELKAPEVAALLDIRPQTVRCYMCGIRQIPRRHLERLQRSIESPSPRTAAA
jgi:hypothetical protein